MGLTQQELSAYRQKISQDLDQMKAFIYISRLFINTVRLAFICANDEMVLYEHLIPNVRKLTEILTLELSTATDSPK